MWLCGFILLLFFEGSRVDAESISTKALHTEWHSEASFGSCYKPEILAAFFQTLLKLCSLGGLVSSVHTAGERDPGEPTSSVANLDQSVSGLQPGSCRTQESSEVWPVNYL